MSTGIILRIAEHYTLGFLEDADTDGNTHFVLGDTEKQAEERSLDGQFEPDRGPLRQAKVMLARAVSDADQHNLHSSATNQNIPTDRGESRAKYKRLLPLN